MDKTTNRKEADRKQIIFTEGAKGRGGKTTLLSSLADFFLAESIPVKLLDADIDNKSRGSPSHLFKGTPKIDIRTDHGLDQFIGMVLDDQAQTALADLGAGSSKETWAWFEQMHDSVREEGIRFLTIGLVTNDSSTTSAILDWADALQNRVDYLAVKNKVAGEDSSYLFESEPGQRFLQLAKPAIIEMERRLPDIQQKLNNRGFSLRQALEASVEIAGPVLSKSYNRMRIKGYVNRLEKPFSEVIDVLLPPYEVLPVSNGSALPNGESDLEAIIERIAPERRVDFLRWRERVKRHGENDELLAVVGYLDTSVVLTDLLSKEAQPEAIKRALAAVEKASKDQAAATARIPRLTLVLNTATLIITAVLEMAVGVLIMVLHQTHIDQKHAKAPEARLARDLATIGASLGYEVSPDGRSITLQVFPGQTWKVRSAQTDQQGTGTITLYDPTW
jgi:hypothetical protein